MLRLIAADGSEHPITSYENYHIKHKEDGCNNLTFDVDLSDAIYPLIQEECRIVNKDNHWLIKKIDDDRISCELDFDFLKQRIYKDYKSSTRTLAQVLESHLPAGWIVEGANVSSIGRTISFDFCTDYDVVYECMKTYDVRFVWNIKDKVLKVVDTSKIVPTGEYLTSELNLKSLSFKGETTSFATRLYAYGKDGIGIEEAIISVGGSDAVYGLPYVDSNSYADKIVCAYFKDERFTVPTNLYNEAVLRLNTLSFPVRSYECKVIDLAKQSKEYEFLDLQMHKKVTLIDAERQIHVVHLVVEYDEYPDDEDNNTVTLSCVPSTIQSSTQSKIESAEEKIEQTRTDFDYRVNMATAMLTGAFGGHIYQENGEMFIMDNPDPQLAQVVWRYNINGIGKSTTGIAGPYTTAMTIDDTFITNLVQAMIIRGDYIEANSIKATAINQEYTDGVLSQAFSAAEGMVKSSFNNVTQYLTNDEETGQLDVLRKDLANVVSTVDGITATYSQSYTGGINYVRNSSGLNSTSNWEKTGVVDTLQSSDTNGFTVSNSCFRLSEDSSLEQVIDNAVIGQTYRISVKVKDSTQYITKGTVTYNGNTEVELFKNTEVKNSWIEHSLVIREIKSPVVTIKFETSGNYLFIADVMMSEGEGTSSWSPAPNEIYTKDVKIDGSGVSVINERQKTVMNSEEFAGYYDDEQVFVLAEDETRLKKITVRDSATITSLRIAAYTPNDDGVVEGVDLILLD